MTGALPDHIEPLMLAESAAQLEGRLRLSACARLVADHGPQAGEARVVLAFGVDEDGVRFVFGRVQADLALTCNRCLEAFVAPVEAQVSLGIVCDLSGAERLPERYEPLIAGTEPLSLVDLVEDELLLAVPLAPAHPPGTCRAHGAGATVSGPARQRPFAALAGYKSRRGG